MSAPPIPKAKRASKLRPYRLLTWLLFAERVWLSRTRVDGTVAVFAKTGPLARALHTDTGRLRSYLMDLHTKGYFTDLNLSRGSFEAVIKPIEGWEGEEAKDG